jgi:hypothetical protein
MFLAIFTKTMIYDFKHKTTRNETYIETNNNETENETTNASTVVKMYQLTQANVSDSEILILIWVIALQFEELRQVKT